MPSILVVFSLVSGEHELESHALSGPRSALGVSLILYFFSALTLTLDADRPLLIAVWVAALVSSGFSLTVFSSIAIYGLSSLRDRINNGAKTEPYCIGFMKKLHGK